MTPLHGIACFYDDGFGARAVSRKTPIYFICIILSLQMIFDQNTFFTLTISLRCSSVEFPPRRPATALVKHGLYKYFEDNNLICIILSLQVMLDQNT